ncbi:hypothetical protein TELCIR_23657, partial [Teladorsagia circumcincta]
MKGNQLFKFNVDTGSIFHPVSGQCLAAEPDGSGFVFMQRCDENAPTQKWVWQ